MILSTTLIIIISNVTSVVTSSLLTIYIKNKINKNKTKEKIYKEILDSITFENEDIIQTDDDDLLYYKTI